MNKPVFQTVLGHDWDKLGTAIRKHYFLKPFSTDKICVRGSMQEIKHSWFAKLLIPGGLLFGAIVPFQANNVPVDVYYRADSNNANIYWDRVFMFGYGNFHFKSHMTHLADNHVIEFVRFSMGMRLLVTVEDSALVFRSQGYIWRLFGLNIPVPIGLFFGHAYVEERPLSDTRIAMQMKLTHPWFGLLFSYKGEFDID